jgi:hypothetical protein
MFSFLKSPTYSVVVSAELGISIMIVSRCVCWIGSKSSRDASRYLPHLPLNGLLSVHQSDYAPNNINVTLPAPLDKEPLSVPVLVSSNKAHGKPKATKVKASTRMPYRVYNSVEGIPIRVGRTALDNDALSMDPKYRVDEYWWLHVAGHAGSHVVVCTGASSFATSYKETLIDAALLAVLNSSIFPKAKTGGSPRVRATVHYTRCSNISKSLKDVAGLVRLGSGYVGQIEINTAKYGDRVERLLRDVKPVNFNDLG